MGPSRLNLPEIDSSLRAVQVDFARINATLSAQRDAMSDEVRANMMAGYGGVDAALAEKIDLFELGNSKRLLELNTLVLCGTDEARRREFAAHIAATERRFYEKDVGGICTLMEWLQRNKGGDVFWRAAGIYLQILTRPELYLEGNHRTGTLIMSYMLAREGEPPFVLSINNAKAYFDPSSIVKGTSRRSLRVLIRVPQIRRRLADLLNDAADSKHLVPLGQNV
jgi:hypothetical protein